MDTLDAEQGTSLSEVDDPESEDGDDATLSSLSEISDEGGHDTSGERNPDDNRPSEAGTIDGGEAIDEGVTDGPDWPSEQGGDGVLEPVSDERAEATCYEGSGLARDFTIIQHALGRF